MLTCSTEELTGPKCYFYRVINVESGETVKEVLKTKGVSLTADALAVVGGEVLSELAKGRDPEQRLQVPQFQVFRHRQQSHQLPTPFFAFRSPGILSATVSSVDTFSSGSDSRRPKGMRWCKTLHFYKIGQRQLRPVGCFCGPRSYRGSAALCHDGSAYIQRVTIAIT